MPTKREAFPSRFFKAADIPDNGLLLKIAKVEREKVGLDQELKWVVYFKGQEKQLVLNGTNWDLIAAALNEEDSDNWGGKAIELFSTQTQFGSKMVDCIRVRRFRPPPAQAASTRPTKPVPPTNDSDDAIPF
jgi:hypothetical protein